MGALRTPLPDRAGEVIHKPDIQDVLRPNHRAGYLQVSRLAPQRVGCGRGAELHLTTLLTLERWVLSLHMMGKLPHTTVLPRREHSLGLSSRHAPLPSLQTPLQ